MSLETIKSRLAKIKALTSSPVEGERAAAKAMLKDLLAKHGLTIDQLQSEKEDTLVELKCRDENELLIVTNIICWILGRCVFKWKEIKKTHGTLFQCLVTKRHAIDIEDACRHYLKEFRFQQELLAKALLHQHNLFAPESDETKQIPPESGEDAVRIRMMMAGMSTTGWNRPAARLDQQTDLFPSPASSPHHSIT